MNKIILTILTSFLITGCGGGNNSYDGVNGLIGSSANIETVIKPTENIVTNLLQQSSANVSRNALLVKDAIESSSLTNAQYEFKKFILSWKKVEATYIAGTLNSALIDTPRFIDFFHIGNEDITEQLDTVIASTAKASDLLFKNSHKSVNALEYILFNSGNDTKRLEMATVMIDALITHLNTIEKYYKNIDVNQLDTQVFAEDLINILIDSAYKLKEWRVGDAAGFTAKYKDNPDATRLEYSTSKYSLEVIASILNAHEEAFSNGLLAISTAGNALAEANIVLANIASAQNAIKMFNAPLSQELTSNKTLTLYNALNALYNSYVNTLTGALKFSVDIIEADGD